MNHQTSQRNCLKKEVNKGKKTKGIKKHIPLNKGDEKNSQGPVLTFSDINEQKGNILLFSFYILNILLKLNENLLNYILYSIVFPFDIMHCF